MKRLFLALPIPEDFKTALTPEIKEAQIHPKLKNSKWTLENQWHLTTHFLGDCPEHLIKELIQLSQGAAGRMSPFTLKARDLTLFPRRGKAHQLWVTFDRSLDFETLVEAQIELLSPFLKYRDEDREALAHLSIARLREGLPATTFHKKLSHLPLLEVTEVLLYESTLSPEGPVYTVLEHFPLG